jgi:hypothetical protein
VRISVLYSTIILLFFIRLNKAGYKKELKYFWQKLLECLFIHKKFVLLRIIKVVSTMDFLITDSMTMEEIIKYLE